MIEPSRPPSSARPKSRGAGSPHRWSDGWNAEDLLRLDADLRMMLTLIADKNWPELAWRTGIVVHDRAKDRNAPAQTLSLVLTLRDKRELGWSSLEVRRELESLGAKVIDAVYRENDRARDGWRRIPATIAIDPYDPSQVVDAAQARSDAKGDGSSLEDRLRALLATKCVRGLALSAQHLRCFDVPRFVDDAPAGVGVPADRMYHPVGLGRPHRKLTGKGVVVGIIDDGCPFAHQDFLVNAGSRSSPNYKARVVRLWDQSSAPTTGWSAGPYGREIDAAAIEAVLAKHVTPTKGVDERAVYDELAYAPFAPGMVASHGGRVAGIAAGNGRSLLGREGVAPKAEIVFVQLPAVLIGTNPAKLDQYMIDAIAYIFDYADAVNKRAVINLSYGGYSGAHDGTGSVEVAIDIAVAQPRRAVVVSAGNGFEADCHAYATLLPGQSTTRTWLLPSEDPTSNTLEIWYGKSAQVEVALTAPDGATTYGPYASPTMAIPISDPASGATIGIADHAPHANGDMQAVLELYQTAAAGLSPGSGPASAGAWTVTITNSGAALAEVHAWIRRDDVGGLGGRREQSRFAPDEAYPGCTIGDTASGRKSISVGAYNRATTEVARYSAAGPTRSGSAGASRRKPDICAPGEGAPHGLGVLATASGRAQPARLGGTSAAAPHVTGLVALIFEYAKAQRKKSEKNLDVARILAGLSLSTVVLTPNQHQQAARYPRVKQSQIWSDVVGGGPVDFKATLDNLFP